jgi:hypothetical protein
MIVVYIQMPPLIAVINISLFYFLRNNDHELHLLIISSSYTEILFKNCIHNLLYKNSTVHVRPHCIIASVHRTARAGAWYLRGWATVVIWARGCSDHHTMSHKRFEVVKYISSCTLFCHFRRLHWSPGLVTQIMFGFVHGSDDSIHTLI